VNLQIKLEFSILLWMASICFGCTKSSENNQQGDKKIKHANPVNSIYTLKITGNEKTGWGYEIYKKEKLFIDQPIIPAIGGNRKFKTTRDAKIIGELVILKLVGKNSDLPSISINELDSLKIQYH
jgi:hypothetical protein